MMVDESPLICKPQLRTLSSATFVMISFSSSVCAVLIIALAILVRFVIQTSKIPSDIRIQLNETTASTWSPKALTADQIATYHKEGAVFVPGFLSTSEARVLSESAEETLSKMVSISKLFAFNRYSNVGFDVWRTSQTVASLSLQGLPRVASQLLHQTPSIRLLRDAYFDYTPGKIGCGWHVDDPGFWPSEPDTSGITIWIALDEISMSNGGGLTVMNRTKFQELEPRHVTEDMCVQASNQSPCEMQSSSPECHSKLEESKLQWDLKPGDAILWDRWTFHRGVPSIDDASSRNEDVHKRRYSVRYIPENARSFGALHPSVQQGQPFDSPYYPQVWPNLLEKEQAAMQFGLEPDIQIMNFPLTVFRIIMYKIEQAWKR